MKAKNKEPQVLDEFMKLWGEDHMVFVGALSGYIFIGNLTAYKRDIAKLDAQAKAALERKTNQVRLMVDDVNKLIDEENEHGDGVNLPRIDRAFSEIKTGISQRRIIETYEKVLDGAESGVAVIIAGAEVGKYWLKSEYDAEHADDREQED